VRANTTPVALLDKEPCVRFLVVFHAELHKRAIRNRDPTQEVLNDPVLAPLREDLKLMIVKIDVLFVGVEARLDPTQGDLEALHASLDIVNARGEAY
jgi:hypothetical protein